MKRVVPKKERAPRTPPPPETSVEAAPEIAELIDAEADEAAKREAKKDAKKRKREEAAAAAAAEAEEDVDDEAAAMNAMMGFGSFGGSKKGR